MRQQLDHLARDLMAERQRLAHPEVADAALAEVGQVRAADAAAGDAHPRLAGFERTLAAFLDPQVVRCVQHGSQHQILRVNAS